MYPTTPFIIFLLFVFSGNSAWTKEKSNQKAQNEWTRPTPSPEKMLQAWNEGVGIPIDELDVVLGKMSRWRAFGKAPNGNSCSWVVGDYNWNEFHGLGKKSQPFQLIFSKPNYSENFGAIFLNPNKEQENTSILARVDLAPETKGTDQNISRGYLTFSISPGYEWWAKEKNGRLENYELEPFFTINPGNAPRRYAAAGQRVPLSHMHFECRLLPPPGGSPGDEKKFLGCKVKLELLKITEKILKKSKDSSSSWGDLNHHKFKNSGWTTRSSNCAQKDWIGLYFFERLR